MLLLQQLNFLLQMLLCDRGCLRAVVVLCVAGMQHSTSCPDLDPAALEGLNLGSGGGSSFAKSRLGSASNSMSRLGADDR